MSAEVEPVAAADSSPELTPLPSPHDDLIGWGLLTVVVSGGLGWLFSPFKIYAIAITVATVIGTIWLVGLEAKRNRQPMSFWMFGCLLLPVTFVALMHFRKRWGMPWRLPHAIVALAAFTAGYFLHGRIWGPAARVTVSCRASGTKAAEGYLCTPRHVGGYQSARACWDLSIVCENGTNLKEHVCSQVTLGQARESEVPFTYSPGVDDCDTIASASVDNLHVEVDPK